MTSIHCLEGVSVKSIKKESVPSNVRRKNIKRLRRYHFQMNSRYDLWFYPYKEDQQVTIFRVDMDHYGNLIANGKFVINNLNVFSFDKKICKEEDLSTKPEYSEKEYSDFCDEYSEYSMEYADH